MSTLGLYFAVLEMVILAVWWSRGRGVLRVLQRLCCGRSSFIGYTCSLRRICLTCKTLNFLCNLSLPSSIGSLSAQSVACTSSFRTTSAVDPKYRNSYEYFFIPQNMNVSHCIRTCPQRMFSGPCRSTPGFGVIQRDRAGRDWVLISVSIRHQPCCAC